MRYLLDTNVVSALRVRGREPGVQAWAAAIPVADQFVASFTIAEVERGVVAKERADPAQGLILRRWFEQRVLTAFAGRILPFDLPAARTLATFPVPERAPLDDAIIAAIAHSAGLTIATRNTRHFEPLNISVVNPWTERP
ncbi:MAG: type II toxin-antitoxin system VapC family toxin [Mobilicoccus sp.]|nr:type II toxin-antitoxin system VapC family toxin [Mobilicoccus sp.]